MENKKVPKGLPTIEEVKTYCEEIKSSVDPNVFLLFYRNKGRKLKNWKGAVRMWEKYQVSYDKQGGEKMENEKSPKANGLIELNQKHTGTLPNGTDINLDISIELNNYDIRDFENISSILYEYMQNKIKIIQVGKKMVNKKSPEGLTEDIKQVLNKHQVPEELQAIELTYVLQALLNSSEGNHIYINTPVTLETKFPVDSCNLELMEKTLGRHLHVDKIYLNSI